MRFDEDTVVDGISNFSRFYASILGQLDRNIRESPYSLTEARVLMEVGRMNNCPANVIGARLNLDRGYLSRLLKRLTAVGLVTEKDCPADNSRLFVTLTEAGRQAAADLEEKSRRQIRQMIANLTGREKERLTGALRFVRHCLATGSFPVTIRTFRPEDIDWMIASHRDLYATEYGFKPLFAHYVAKYSREFAAAYDPAWENIWIAEADGKPAGSIAIVRTDADTAQLRWFLLEPRLRGAGIGHRLMETVLDFCRERQYKSIFLWTVSLLAAARHLYELYGFTLTETKPNNEWSDGPVIEERWDLPLLAGGEPAAGGKE